MLIYKALIDIILIFMQIFLYIRSVNSMYKANLKKNKGRIPIKYKVVVTQEGIITYIENNNNSCMINFSNIKRLIKTKNYYFLVSKMHFIYPLRKESFIKGEQEEFEKFIKNKRILIGL